MWGDWMNKKPIWQMIREAVSSIGGNVDVVETSDIRRYIQDNYGGVKDGTLNCQIAVCCVNRKSRIHYTENLKPRLANGQYDFLFYLGRGQVRLYNPEVDGIWEIAIISDSLTVRQLDGAPNDIPTIASFINVSRISHGKSRRDDVPHPSHEQVNLYLAKWDSLENYTAQESALNKLFWHTAPTNNSLDDILIKVATLNDFYSTHIKSIFTVARHILQLGIDEQLKFGDENIVDKIANVTMPNGKTRNEFSFATKYCSHHRADDYPIYDSYVDKLLCYFRDVDGFASFHRDDLRKFSIFKRTILEFRKFYSLENFTIKAIDKYLWQLGKECFPNKYYGQKSKK